MPSILKEEEQEKDAFEFGKLFFSLCEINVFWT